jgi:MFS family permease
MSIADTVSVPALPLLRQRNFCLFMLARMLWTLGGQMLSVAVGWQIYGLTHSPAALGYVGLVQFVPVILLALPAGDLADQVDRRFILIASYIVQAGCAILLMLLALEHSHALGLYYGVLALFGASRAFYGPASQSFLPLIVERDMLPKAIAWTSSAFQVAVIVGPAAGGLLYGLGAGISYAVCSVLFVAMTLAMIAMTTPRRVIIEHNGLSTLRRIAAGIGYVRSQPILLGAISLDLFAVLLGGAAALLPVYAHDILHAGPEGLGILRSAMALGATATAVGLGLYPLQRRAGHAMFLCVAIFGLATVLFGISTSFAVSLGMLFIMGASDMISVYIRSTLVQIVTPDAMRGRVSAVNWVFVDASNELGEFESGMTAAWLGTVPSVVLGGIGTLAVVGLWAWLFPELRRTDRLTDPPAA